MRKGQSPFRSGTFDDWLTPRIARADAGYHSPCWLWRLGVNRKGYVMARVPSLFGVGKQVQALHRVVYTKLAGPIPEGLVIDHLCRNRACLNPAHLEPVTSAENTRRGDNAWRRRSSCASGHVYTPETTHCTPKGYRICRICRREKVRAYRARRLAVKSAAVGRAA